MSGTVLENVRLDRPHRYRVGSVLRHVDTERSQENRLVVVEQTFRVRSVDEDGETRWVAYPTYRLSGYRDEVVDDVLCTLDLVGYYE